MKTEIDKNYIADCKCKEKILTICMDRNIKNIGTAERNTAEKIFADIEKMTESRGLSKCITNYRWDKIKKKYLEEEKK